jgi:hypothetical protein
MLIDTSEADILIVSSVQPPVGFLLVANIDGYIRVDKISKKKEKIDGKVPFISWLHFMGR